MIDLAHLGPGSTVLDLGTGIGEPAVTAARAVAPGMVTAVDVSPTMLDLARGRAEREGIANVEFVHADAASYRPERRFDAILSRWGLMFLPNVGAALTHHRNALRPGGRFVAATWSLPQDVPVISLPMAIATRRFNLEPPLLAGGPFALHDRDALAGAFDAAGYVDVEVRDHTVQYAFASAGEYFEHASDIAPPIIGLLRQLDETQIAELYREIERTVEERFAQPDGSVLIPNRAIIVAATAP
jgi:ubiquinone/menaquinone biosynthesis C-methylase UbiE